MSDRKETVIQFLYSHADDIEYKGNELQSVATMVRNCVDELKTELDRTKKQLEIAVDALKEINCCALDFTRARDALKQINNIDKGE